MMHNSRTVGLLTRVFSDLRLYCTSPQTFYSLRETTDKINKDLKAESNFNISVRRLCHFTAKLLENDGLDLVMADELTKLLSTNFRNQIDERFKNTFYSHQINCRKQILLNLELRAINSNNSKWSKREIAGYECILRTLTGCVYSPVVKSGLKHIRDNPFSEKVAANAVSDFLSRTHSDAYLRK